MRFHALLLAAAVLLAGCTIPPDPAGVKAIQAGFVTLENARGPDGNLTAVRMQMGIHVEGSDAPTDEDAAMHMTLFQDGAIFARLDASDSAALSKMAAFCSPSRIVIGPDGLKTGTPSPGSVETRNSAGSCAPLLGNDAPGAHQALQRDFERLRAASPGLQPMFISMEAGNDPLSGAGVAVVSTKRTADGWVASIEKQQSGGQPPLPLDVTLRNGLIERMAGHFEAAGSDDDSATFTVEIDLGYGPRPAAPDIRGETVV